jgi:hypothetical protein
VGQIYARQTCALSLLDQTTGSFVRTVFTCRRLSDLACVVLCILPDSPSRSLNSISTLNRRSQTSELAFVLKSTLRPPSPSAALWSPARHRAVFLCLARSPAIVYNSVAANFVSQKTTSRPLDATRPLREHHRPRTRSRHHGPTPQSLVFHCTEKSPHAIRHTGRQRILDSGRSRRLLDCRSM